MIAVPRRFLDRTTLRQQITCVAGVLCALLIAVTAGGSTYLARHEALVASAREVQSVARSFADRLDQDMAERFREVQNLALLGPIRDGWQSAPETVRPVLNELQRSLPTFAWIGFADTNGEVRVSTRRLLEGVNVSARPWFVSGLRGASVEDVHDAQLLASLLGPTRDGAPFRFVDIAVPVHDARGVLQGVLGAHLSWGWASDLRDEVLASRNRDLGDRISVLDRTGLVLLGRELGTRPFGHDRPLASVTRRTADGPMLATFAETRGRGAYPGLGWTVVVERPLAVVLAPADRTTVLLAGLGVGATVLGLLAIALFARRLAGPVGELTDAFGAVGRDPKAGTIRRLHGSREVVALSAAARSLLRRIGTAQNEAKAALDAASVAGAAARAAEQRNMRLGAELHALQTLADTDALTGLLNRRAFLPFAEDAMNYLKRYGRTLCVLMVDIDHFKRINDTFGHAVGDDVIRAVGATIDEMIRTTDKVARFGGEEFVVLLREIDIVSAEALADRIRERIRLTPIGRGGAAIACTVSIGVAAARKSDVDIEEAIERADRALYAAKSNGRNRVVREPDVPDGELREAA